MSEFIRFRRLLPAALWVAVLCAALGPGAEGLTAEGPRKFNGPYTGENLSRVAFPMGGMGAGMVCLEGTGCLSHVSVRHKPDVFNEPFVFAALAVKGRAGVARVLEGPVPSWKLFGVPGAGNGLGGTTYGFPRFENAEFLARFPFATLRLSDRDMPVTAELTGWSPFTPPDPDDSSLPVAALEYRFRNRSGKPLEAVFSFHSRNFMRVPVPSEWGGTYEPGDRITPMENGFALEQEGAESAPHRKGAFAVFTDEPAVVDHAWFRGGWWDSVTILWKTVAAAEVRSTPPMEGASPGASLYVPFRLEPGAERTVRVLMAWHVPCSDLRTGWPTDTTARAPGSACASGCTYTPWYAGRFKSVAEAASDWKIRYSELRQSSAGFRDAFFDTDLPAEAVEAAAANLSILKSPTVLRQADGRFWAWEGCHDNAGCCHGSCTHVWNYGQALAHLFPSLERTLRETEFRVNQDGRGHQTFRANLPIGGPEHGFHAAADGQLGGIIKTLRDWRISGDTAWLKSLWPAVRQSLDYCIGAWDPDRTGAPVEPHHNTYDIEFWGPDPLCATFYAGALAAAVRMGEALGDDVSGYRGLLDKARLRLENELYNGEFFFQKVQWQGLRAPNPLESAPQAWNIEYSPEALDLLRREGPKYQVGSGCLSDGVLGLWMADLAGLDPVADPAKVKSHLKSVARYNMRHDLSGHANPQRPGYACGKEGGLLLCTWPRGGEPSLPFVYSNEVWTGIEYQAASHMIRAGLAAEGLDVVRTARSRYDGRVRDPFDEYECGHWYARALSSYGLLEALTGARYDAVDGTLTLDPRVRGDFRSFLCTGTGFGTVGLNNGKPFFACRQGKVEIRRMVVAGRAAR